MTFPLDFAGHMLKMTTPWLNIKTQQLQYKKLLELLTVYSNNKIYWKGYWLTAMVWPKPVGCGLVAVYPKPSAAVLAAELM